MIDFRVLGPVEVWRDGERVDLGGRKQRATLALLLLDRGRAVSQDRLVDALWGESPPRTALTSLQNFVSQLRKLIGPGVVVPPRPGTRSMWICSNSLSGTRAYARTAESPCATLAPEGRDGD